MRWEETDVKHWNNLKDKTPAEGQCVVMLFMNGEKDRQFWTTEIGYYCDGAFYNLQYDPHTGVLRKMFVEDTVSYWCHCVYFPMDEIVLDK